MKEVAQLDQIRCACRGIWLLDSIKDWSHSDEGSGRGGRKMRGFFVDFALFFLVKNRSFPKAKQDFEGEGSGTAC